MNLKYADVTFKRMNKCNCLWCGRIDCLNLVVIQSRPNSRMARTYSHSAEIGRESPKVMLKLCIQISHKYMGSLYQYRF